MGKNWENAAGLIWPALISHAASQKQLTYSDLAPIINTNPLSVGYALGPIQTYCLEQKLPPLTVIVIGKTSGIPGGGFIAWDIDDLDTAFEQVYSFNWSAVPNPFKGYGTDDSTDTFVQRLLENPDESEDIYNQVPARGNAQKIFRKALLKAYDYQCAICGCSFVEILEASHIIPWAECGRAMRISPNNGILLCSNHHGLFDSGYLLITDSYHVKYIDEEFDEENYSDADMAMSMNIDGQKIMLPKNPRLHPSRELLDKKHTQ